MKIEHYIQGSWVTGTGSGTELKNASNGAVVGIADSTGINFKEILNYARGTGGPTLRAMTFHERGRALKALALYLLEKKEHFYRVSSFTGATKIDSWIDIEGGIGNLFTMATKGRRQMPDTPFCVDGDYEPLSKNGTFGGHHIYVPKEGCAIHINAFNFPVWGMLEKIAVNLLAGVPAVVKPATLTSYLTETVVKEIIASKILPEGSLQLICGSASGILDHLTNQDIVTFTGSAETGRMLKSHSNIVDLSVPFNMEADSLNCSILGPDATPDTEEFQIFIKEVAREITVKAGQKCTAIRRTIVPDNLIEAVTKALKERLLKTTIGDPNCEGVRMGPLAGRSQFEEVSAKVKELNQTCEILLGGNQDFEIIGGDRELGAFFPPTLLYCSDPLSNKAVHNIEAFGPVTTLMPYSNTDEAIQLAKLGEGSLVGSIITGDDQFAKDIVYGSAAYHGRFLVLNKDCAKESTGHGSPMPQLVHGGPGRAGGGEEMGGIRGVFHYMQRTAIQGSPTTLTALTGVYQPGSQKIKSVVHPFTQYFEDLEIGHSLSTEDREITVDDIESFCNLSGDHFYAHKPDTDFSDTIFEGQVAHGYFIISAAAGLFVDPPKGPVLANYGLDELRFTKPMYVGTRFRVNLTVKEKTAQEDREDEIPRGIVRWQVEVLDDEDEVAALATILTLVAKRPA
ncbi:MAG: phenylacetic acid degradation bifunctional protein PaaZ [Halobacteriovoraceae bacterium]|jgi:oxepin-CoA hydrolase / 3-oxo-5,6-dehydrosuberyl-CoA semialdehyde dehydrogenase|nr:phenylacetic acid degradation bifunctional protein PaaZ [Halobacteriovoraceae bacterium]MBT5094990.1 phenylacetic acid degradation bifunctional protein PaaZ [Halobacteriovoraceae bacterium]